MSNDTAVCNAAAEATECSEGLYSLRWKCVMTWLVVSHY
jgi:hypothetical protein